MMAQMITTPDKSKLLPHNTLTDREFQVFSLLASGMRKAEIAEKLAISVNTLSNHRNNIMKKMNISSNSELTRYAIQNGIIQ
jgi:DNA-binding NarL/FixJ family response regulator